MHNNTSSNGYIAGFGVEDGALAYSVWTGGIHRFYTETTTSSGGNLHLSINLLIFMLVKVQQMKIIEI